jgi:hypothetical protein
MVGRNASDDACAEYLGILVSVPYSADEDGGVVGVVCGCKFCLVEGVSG